MSVSRARRSRVLGGSIAKLAVAVCLTMLGATAVATASQAGHHHKRSAHAASAAHAAIVSAAHHLRSARSARRKAEGQLRRCRHRHPDRPHHCARARRKLARARRRVARARTQLFRRKAHLAPSRVARKARSAPHITAAGETVKWNRVAKVKRYVFVRKLPGEPNQYSDLATTSITPPPVAGATVHYSVRTAVAGSRWAPEVAIHYAARKTSGNGTGRGKGSGHGAEGSTEPEAAGTSTGSTGAATEGTELAAPLTSETPTSETYSAFGPFIKGVNTNLQGWGAQAVPQIASEMSELGVNWEREDLAWSSVEPQKGVFDWSSFDQIVAAAKENGITILPVVGYAPSWTSPSDASDYAAFVKAAVERYGPGTSANLQWWELWNEPYAPYAWSNQTPDAEAYARDALAAGEAAKSVAPSVKLLLAAEYNDSPQTGGSSPWETTWVSDMFTAAPTLGSYISGVAVHPYGGDPALPLLEPGSWKNINEEWAFQRVDTIHAQFLEHGVNVPFWITEDGWSTDSVSEAEQAKDYSALIEAIAARPWIRALFPYCLREFSPEAGNVESAYGLLKFGTWQPKQAFAVLQSGLAGLS